MSDSIWDCVEGSSLSVSLKKNCTDRSEIMDMPRQKAMITRESLFRVFWEV